jgi:membrane protein
MGAAIAFYATLSLAPFLLVLATVAAFFLGADTARGYLVDQSEALVGSEGSAYLAGLLSSGGSSTAKGLAALVGVVSTLAGATAGFAEVQAALNRVFRVPGRQGWRAMLGARSTSLLLVLCVGVLLVASLALTAFATRSLTWLQGSERVLRWLALVTNEGVGIALGAVLFGLLLKVLPDRHVPWRLAVRGGMLTAVLFSVAKILIGWYIGRSTGAAAYGAAAALVVLMLWIYFSAQVFLLGAEFTAAALDEVEGRAGVPRQPAP